MDQTSGWTAGYVTELAYTHGYYTELCPGQLRLACLSAGIALPEAQPLRYLELGYGQGLSINIHAAAIAGEFWGTDFNPAQAAHARQLATISGVNATLLDESFVELAARRDLPEFDIIALHGIWTWVSDENRRMIVDLLRRKLRIGGIAYVSYNCLPGWAHAMPLRHLVKLHADIAGAEAAGMVANLDAALIFANQVADAGALYFRGNPSAVEQLKTISGQRRNYLAHEYLNKHWQLTTFSEIAEILDEAKLSFVASAHLIDHVDNINLSAEGQALLNEIKHPILRQSVRDYFVNRAFRRDIFVKGPRLYTPLEKYEAACSQVFVLTTSPQDIPRKVTGSRGEAALQDQIYRPLLEVMVENDSAPKKFAYLVQHPKLSSLHSAQLFEALLVLAGCGHVQLALEEVSDVARARCLALNRHLCERARSSADISFLASPVTGGGILVPRFHQLFILASQQGERSEAEKAAFVWNILSSQGERLTIKGKPLDTAEENLAELTELMRQFEAKRKPVLSALSVI